MQAGPVEAADPTAETFLRAVCVKSCHAPEENQLELNCGDIVIVIEQDATGWWGGHKEGDEERAGWFPGSSVRVLTEDEQAGLTLPIESRQLGLQTESSSPQRGARHVASPQRNQASSLARDPRRSAPSIGDEAAGDGLGTATEAATEPLRQENVRLRQELEDLSSRCQNLRRQSGLDQNSLQEWQAAAQREREERERLEAAREQEKRERELLEATLQDERQRRQMLEQQLEVERRSSMTQQESLGGRIWDGREELRHGSGISLSNGRVSEVSSHGCVRRLEDQLRNVDAHRVVAADATSAPEQPRRSLNAAAELPMAAVAAPPPLPVATVARSTPPGVPAHSPVPAISADASPSAASLSGEKEVCSVTTWRPPHEEPAPGIVSQTVSLFNSYVQQKKPTNQRSASCSRIQDHGRAERMGRQSQSPLVLLNLPGAASSIMMPTCPALPHGLDDDQEYSGSLSLNMSPLQRRRPEGFAQNFEDRQAC